MPLTTKELCLFAAIDPRTLRRWKGRYHVTTAIPGRWTVTEIRALEEAICREVAETSRNLRAELRRKNLSAKAA